MSPRRTECALSWRTLDFFGWGDAVSASSRITKRWTEAATAARNSRDVASPHYIPLKHFEPIGGSVNLSVMRLCCLIDGVFAQGSIKQGADSLRLLS